MRDLTRAYYEAVFDTDRDRALELIKQALDRGVAPEELLFSVVIPSIDNMMHSVSEHGPASLAQHFMCAQIASEALELLLPRFAVKPTIVGRVVIGTSVGDLHALGKRIVSGCLKAHLIEVVDLGLSVQPGRFVDEAMARGAEVIGISSMMVHTARDPQGSLAVRQLLKERAIESRIKILVGGAPYRFDPELYKAVQADAWAADAVAAPTIVGRLFKEARS